MTQTELAERLGQSQAYVSKSERGDRRIDVIELWRICQELGVPFATFNSRLEGALEALAPPKRMGN